MKLYQLRGTLAVVSSEQAFAEHNTGAFKNHFIAFSGRPQLIKIKGDTFADRLRYVASFNEVADTNLEAVFDLILNTAATNFADAKAKFEAHGYQLPKIVFRNVRSRNTQQPVTRNEQGVAPVSGCTPGIFHSFL